MLNLVSADAKADACRHSLAAPRAGAFVCEGASIGSRASVMVAPVFLPEISLPGVRWAAGYAEAGHAGIGAAAAMSIGASGGSVFGGSSVFGGGGGVIGDRKVKTQQLNQTTRINPVIPGGVGPHPAREPDPV
jgi:hypothetical protein